MLVGLMASGKSTVGRRLAARLDRPFVDNDDALERHTGRTARAIADQDGAAELHRLETAALAAALARTDPAVVAAAAAAPLDESIGRELGAHEVVYLRADPATLARRIRRSGDGHRPFVAEDAERVLVDQYTRRDDAYRALADLTVDAAHGTPDELAGRITRALARR